MLPHGDRNWQLISPSLRKEHLEKIILLFLQHNAAIFKKKFGPFPASFSHLHKSMFSCNHLSSCHAAISTPLMISSTIELSYFQSQNNSLYQRAQKEEVHCQYAILFQDNVTTLRFLYIGKVFVAKHTAKLLGIVQSLL